MFKGLVKFLFGKRNWTEDQKAAVKDYTKLTIAWSLIFEVVYFIFFFAYVKKLEKDENFYNKNKAFYEKVLTFFRKIKESFSFAPDTSSDVDKKEDQDDDDYVDPELD